MRSEIAEQVREDQARSALAMTPGERVAVALALGERAVRDYMVNFAVDRRQAVRALRRAGQAGRRYSACLDEDLERRHE